MSQERIERAVEVLRRGGVVAFPTETVYGLGADARDARAVQRVFEIKGRPATNPVIVHVASADVARRYAATWPAAAASLVERFWPGPLTIVLPKTDQIVPAVTAGRHTVGLRCPDHPLTLELLRRFDGPLIGPSANRSSRLSPTTAQDVRDELGDAIDMILDGGPCRVGIESTVLDLSAQVPAILRPGAVSRQQIEQVIGPVVMSSQVVDVAVPAMSPGQQPVHYSPITATYRFERRNIDELRRWLADHGGGRAVVVWCGQPEPLDPAHTSIVLPDRAEDYARQMYSALRSADRLGCEAIWVEMPPDTPEWVAVRDRLSRASRPPPQR